MNKVDKISKAIFLLHSVKDNHQYYFWVVVKSHSRETQKKVSETVVKDFEDSLVEKIGLGVLYKL